MEKTVLRLNKCYEQFLLNKSCVMNIRFSENLVIMAQL